MLPKTGMELIMRIGRSSGFFDKSSGQSAAIALGNSSNLAFIKFEIGFWFYILTSIFSLTSSFCLSYLLTFSTFLSD